MIQNDDRYQAWSDTAFQSWTDGDSAAMESLWAEDATRLSIDPFDENEPLRGRATIIKSLEAWKGSDPKLLKNMILSSDSDYGIGNARAQWKGQDGRRQCSLTIFGDEIITLKSNANMT